MGRISAEWLQLPVLQDLFTALNCDGHEARVVGGAVRDYLLGLPVNEIDFAATSKPPETTRLIEAAGFKAVPTGEDHGTVTAVRDGRSFEITTLRRDVKTDGRHAEVEFGTDWEEDATRRDFTINALYVDADGEMHDPLGVRQDVEDRQVRFIGDAGTRIAEDYLRILRFFRFFARFGSGRPDADGLKACARLKSGLTGLSVERIWQEVSKLLVTRDPGRAILWMRTTGVLTAVVPESENWGIDLIAPLLRAELEQGWEIDLTTRLAAMLPPQKERVEAFASRLKISNRAQTNLMDWLEAKEIFDAADTPRLRKALYLGSADGQIVKGKLEYARRQLPDAKQRGGLSDEDLLTAIDYARTWQRPGLPVAGRDLLELGFAPGPGIGEELTRLSQIWIESDFTLTNDELLAKISSSSGE